MLEYHYGLLITTAQDWGFMQAPATRRAPFRARSLALGLAVAACLGLLSPADEAFAWQDPREFITITDVYGNPLTSGEIDIAVLQQGIIITRHPQTPDEDGWINAGVTYLWDNTAWQKVQQFKISGELISASPGEPLWRYTIITHVGYGTLHPNRSYTLVYEQWTLIWLRDPSKVNSHPTGLGFTIDLVVTGGSETGEDDGNGTGKGTGTDEGEGAGAGDVFDDSEGASDETGKDSESTDDAETDDEQSTAKDATAQGSEGQKSPSLSSQSPDSVQQDAPAPSAGNQARQSDYLDDTSTQGVDTLQGNSTDALTRFAGASPAGGAPSAGTTVAAYRLIADKTPLEEPPQEKAPSYELAIAGVPLLWLALMSTLALALPLGAAHRHLTYRRALHLPSRLIP
jgi:hypothetical protein